MSSSRALIPEPPLLVLPSLAVAVGLNEAMVLQQLHFLANCRRPGRGGERWVEMGNADLQHTFPFLSKNTLFRAVYKLRDAGLLTIKEQSGQPNRYRLEYEAITAVLDNPLPKMGRPNVGRAPTQDGVGTLPIVGRVTIKEVLDSETLQLQGGVDNTEKPMPMGWLPSDQCQNELRIAGFNPEFAASLLPEFRTYWTKRGDAKDWDSVFCWHVRTQAEKKQQRDAMAAKAAGKPEPYRPRYPGTPGPPVETQQGRQPPAAEMIAAFTPSSPLSPDENRKRFAEAFALLK
ncbi:replication initiation protein [Stenotrophomonas phage StM171]|nr:replication initiation protein [Stenotrophomonas phage StM171]